MAFTVNDFQDLTKLLAAHPEWRTELRRLLLTEELLALPNMVKDLVAAQQQTAQQLAELSQRVDALSQQVSALTAAQLQSERRLTSLETKFDTMDAKQTRMEQSLATLKGLAFEEKYARNAPGYFGQWLRRVRVLIPGGLDAATEDLLEARLTRAEVLEVFRLDLLAKGLLHRSAEISAEMSEVYIAMEVSSKVDQGDIQRAQRRAALLRKAGLLAIPVVAGESLADGADEMAATAAVAVLQDGRSWGWEEALAATQA